MDNSIFFNMAWRFLVIHRFKIIAFLISIMLVSNACSQVNRYLSLPDDHLFEEGAESLIESQTGLDIDLTPSSIEVFHRDF